MRASRLTPVVIALCILGCGGGRSTDEDGDTATDLTEVVDAPDDTASDPLPDGDETGCAIDGDCDDSDPCTEDVCNTDTGDCETLPVDADADGYPAATVDGTACGGSDCDDADAEIYPGSATRRCLEDGDCNGNVDADNDDDGDDSIDCGGGDCEDEIAEVNSGIAPGCGDDPADPVHDLDCNGNVDVDNDDDGFDSADCTSVTPSDCDDAEASINPDASEVCFDGVDQDCDEIIDGPVLVISPRRLATGERSFHPEIVWSGSEYALVWEDDDMAGEQPVYLARVDTSGVLIGTYRRVNPGSTGISGMPSVTWTGSEYGVAWENYDAALDPHLRFRTVSADASSMGSQVDLFSPGDPYSVEDPTSIWTGSEHVVFWRSDVDGNDEIYMRRIGTTGSPVGTTVRLTTAADYTREPSAVWTGSTIGLAYYDRRAGNTDIYFALLDPTGATIGSEVQVTTDTASSFAPSIAWSGSEFGILWGDSRDPVSTYTLYFARIAAGGTMIGTEMRASIGESSTTSNDLEWTGAGWVAVWSDSGAGMFQIFTNVLDPSGTPLYTASDILIVPSAGGASQPDLVWTGTGLGMTYFDGSPGSEDPHFTVLSLCD